FHLVDAGLDAVLGRLEFAFLVHRRRGRGLVDRRLRIDHVDHHALRTLVRDRLLAAVDELYRAANVGGTSGQQQGGQGKECFYVRRLPQRPASIRFPTPPGGATDALPRRSGARLSELRGQPVIVENKPGANQIIGAEYVAKSAPDGNTLLVSDASSFVINPHLYRNMAYDGLRGFTPITVLVRFPWVVAEIGRAHV